MSNLQIVRPTQNTALPLVVLQDLTDLPRVGFRGAEAAEFLSGHGFALPEIANRALEQQDGTIVARLSQTEYLLLGCGSDAGERVADEEATWELDHQANYLLPRQDSHAWFELSGAAIEQVMAKICGVDLRQQSFGTGLIAQTSAARINVIVIRSTRNDIPCFHLLFDRASREYFHGAVLDAMQEFLTR
ncbi:sarcosine oxidase subunit gamma [Pseudomonas alloputida]|uniref:sarcosine oxidase subunit gamma n=1 Tax=Pseudomonas TaxID=286 RepID=UPI003EE9ED76